MLMESHIGVVMANNTDPSKQYGIECYVDSIDDGVYPALFRPIFPPFRIVVPNVGQQVEVLIPGNEDGFPGECDIGTIDYTEFVFYTGTIFDEADGKIPNDFKTNYPKRAGLLWDVDGTIIYYDSTKNSKEFIIKLTDGKTYITIKEDEIRLVQDQVDIQLKGQDIVFSGKTKLGGQSAAEELLKGTTVHSAFNTLVASWIAAATALAGTVDPTGAAAGAYGTALLAALNVFQPTLGSWKSNRHTLDT